MHVLNSLCIFWSSDQHLGLIFSEEGGFLKFLKSCIAKKPQEKFKLEAFRLINWIVQQKNDWKYAIRPYCLPFKVIFVSEN